MPPRFYLPENGFEAREMVDILIFIQNSDNFIEKLYFGTKILKMCKCWRVCSLFCEKKTVKILLVLKSMPMLEL